MHNLKVDLEQAAEGSISWANDWARRWSTGVKSLGSLLLLGYLTGCASAGSGGSGVDAAAGSDSQSQAATATSIARNYQGKPDLSGIWQAIGTANWNLEDHGPRAGLAELGAIGATPPGKGVVVGGKIPYQDWAKEKQQQNFAGPAGADPEAKCFLPSVPRATYLPYPFQVLQGTGKIMIVYSFAQASRTIHLDKAEPEAAPIDSWMGRSHGRWDGDTLVVDAAGFNGQAWLDRAGNFASDTLVVEERYTPMGANALLYEATLEDPNVYTEPWKISMPLYRRLEPDAELVEFKCVEFSEELLYGHLRKGAGT